MDAIVHGGSPIRNIERPRLTTPPRALSLVSGRCSSDATAAILIVHRAANPRTSRVRIYVLPASTSRIESRLALEIESRPAESNRGCSERERRLLRVDHVDEVA